jgi:hypothetical protein
MGGLLGSLVVITVAGVVLLAFNALLHRVVFRSGTGLGPRGRRLGAVAVAVHLLGSACVSVRALPPAAATGAAGGAAVRVRIYESVGARKAGLHTVRTIVSELWRKERGEWVLEREEREAAWTAVDLRPGTYRVAVERWVNEGGVEERLPSTDHATFKVARGERVDVDVVLKHPGRPLAYVIVPAVVIGGIYFLGQQAMSDWHPLGNLEFH